MNVFEKFNTLEKEVRTFGLEWNNEKDWIDQVKSEIAEVEEVLDKKMSRGLLEEEIGDLLHAVVSVSYHHNINAHNAFEKSIDKFEKRYRAVKKLAEKQNLNSLKNQPQETINTLWKEAKKLTE